MIDRISNKLSYLSEWHKRHKESMLFCKDDRVKLFNWSRPFAQDRWLIDFIECRGLLDNRPKVRIALYSVFGPAWMTLFDRADMRVFVERENLHKPHFTGFLHRFLDDEKFQLSLGFDDIEHPNYLRFPFWLMWTLFPPTVDYEMVKRHVNRANHFTIIPDGKSYCAYVCSHDDLNRKRIFEEFNAIEKISCPGRLFHNDDTLKQHFNDDKIAYLGNFKFNLTPENSDSEGYVTEKLFEAISAGTIPIYNGSLNNPEPDILNQNAIIFIKLGEDNSQVVNFVRELHVNNSLYSEFANQPRYNKNAAECIWCYYETLESKLRTIIANI